MELDKKTYTSLIAEFRGPGIHHSLDDTTDDYDPDMTSSGITRGLAGFARSGRIILLGDGTEVLTDMNEEEMFDNAGIQSSGQHPRVEDVSEDSVDPHSTGKEGNANENTANGDNAPAGEAKDADTTTPSSNSTETKSSPSTTSTSENANAQSTASSDKETAASTSSDSNKAKESS